MGQLSKPLFIDVEAEPEAEPLAKPEESLWARREFNPEAPAFVPSMRSLARRNLKDSLDVQTDGPLGSYCPGAELLAGIREVPTMMLSGFRCLDSINNADFQKCQNGKTTSPPPFDPSGKPDFGNDTMKAQLQALQCASPDCVFIARGINKLGFASAEILTAHFSHYGEVKDVYVSHSRVKSSRKLRGEEPSTEHYWRLRAAGVGFVVMASPETTARILAEGSEQYVNGIKICLRPFHVHADAKDKSATDEEEYSDTSGQQEQTIEAGTMKPDNI